MFITQDIAIWVMGPAANSCIFTFQVTQNHNIISAPDCEQI